jgi:phage-related protein
MSCKLKKVPAAFYQLASGREPVKEWLQELSKEDRKIIGADIATVEYGWPIGMPTCRPVGDGLWEVRSNLESHRIARVIFCIFDRHIVLLNGFTKKTQKTPTEEIALAKKRKKELEK